MQVETNVVQDLVTALSTNINVNTMMKNVTLLVPFIGSVVIFSFIYRITRRTTKGAAKGKANM